MNNEDSPHLTFVEVTKEDIETALALVAKYPQANPKRGGVLGKLGRQVKDVFWNMSALNGQEFLDRSFLWRQIKRRVLGENWDPNTSKWIIVGPAGWKWKNNCHIAYEFEDYAFPDSELGAYPDSVDGAYSLVGRKFYFTLHAVR
jgi:hypothetical protein